MKRTHPSNQKNKIEKLEKQTGFKMRIYKGKIFKIENPLNGEIKKIGNYDACMTKLEQIRDAKSKRASKVNTKTKVVP